MSILISNSADAAHYLKQNQSKLQKSLKRLSSGKKIIGGADDPGGLAVSMKLNASIKRLAGAESNVQNGLSFLEVQDGMLETVGNIVTRMSELKGLYDDDPLKSSDEKDSYDTEFKDLQSQLDSIVSSKFNGVSLFNSTEATYGNLKVDTSQDKISIGVSADGGTSITIYKSLLKAGLSDGTNDFTSGNLTLDEDNSGVTVDNLNTVLDSVAWLRSQNGGGQGRLQFMQESLSLQRINMTAALSRIEDIDLAAETANLAKHSIMTQASAAMVAQANNQNDIALMLLS
jgi:flagellin